MHLYHWRIFSGSPWTLYMLVLYFTLLELPTVFFVRDEWRHSGARLSKWPHLASASVALTIAHTATNTAGTPGEIQKRKSAKQRSLELASTGLLFCLSQFNCVKKTDGRQGGKMSPHVSQKLQKIHSSFLFPPPLPVSITPKGGGAISL